MAFVAAFGMEVVDTRYPTRDVVIAERVLAPVRGTKDDAVRLQEAIDAVASKGGGVVFLAAGEYRFVRSVTVRRGVTVRGDYCRERPAAGTVLDILGGRGDEGGTPAFSLENGSGLVGLAFFYPEQNLASPVKYPWTVRTAPGGAAGNNQTVMDCTFVNSWKALRVGPDVNECHVFRRVRICALKVGLVVDMTTDIGRVTDVTVSPTTWAESGFPNVPGEPAVRAYLLSNDTVGAEYRRSDWEYIRRLKIDGYRTGLRFARANVPTNAVLSDSSVTGCTTALDLQALNWVGIAAYSCRFEGFERSVACAEGFDSVAQFHTCSFGADFTGGGRRAKGALLVAGGTRRVAPTEMAWPRPAGAAVLDASTYGVSTASPDNTPALQKALDAAGGMKHGATVYVPAGYYRCRGSLSIPTGVELRGSSDVPHHTQNAGTVLLVLVGKGNEKSQPFVSLAERSGLRGIGFWHPEQPLNDPVPYPWTVRSLGSGCWLCDVNIGNGWLGVDFGAGESGGHRISYLSGAFFKQGLVVGSSSSRGWVEDLQFNPHYSLRRPAGLPWTPGTSPEWAPAGEHPLYVLARKQLCAILFQDCADEHVTGTFVYAARDALVFRGKVDAKVLVHGADTCCSGVNLQTDARSNVDMALGQFVPLGAEAACAVVASEQNEGRAYFAASQIWPRNPVCVNDGSGTVIFDMFNSCAGGFAARRGRMLARNGIFRKNLSWHLKRSNGVVAELTDCISEHGDVKIDSRTEVKK